MPNDLRPPSAVSHVTGWLGLAGALAMAAYLTQTPGILGTPRTLLMMAAVILPMVVWTVLVERVHLRESTGIDWSRPRPWRDVLRTSAVKWVGLAATVFVIGLIYFAVRSYKAAGFQPYFYVLQNALPYAVPLAMGYVAWVDRYQRQPKDGYYQAGLWVMGRWREVDWTLLQDYALAWAVKAFFLAFMASILPQAVNHFTQASTWANLVQHAGHVLSLEWLAQSQGYVGQRLLPLVAALVAVIFFVDVLFGAIGYVMTFRPLDTHIRSAHPTLLGWVAALSCYPPFTIMGNGMALDYRQTPEWFFWFSELPVLATLWGLAIVMLALVYAWSTMVFGLRFSNLTHRGILTHGPYAWTKHPAYLSKVLFWWMVHMPFLNPHSGWEALRNTLLLGFISWVYWLRAKTEERHLRQDPVYVAYERAMAQKRPHLRFI